MSAISVIYDLKGRPVEPDEMRAVLDGLKHRGDDGSGIWIDGPIGLGHRMRWTTPESVIEKLPWKSPESSSVITCDARIDNRNELISQLPFPNKRSEEITDSEIILRAYERWSQECLPKLIGDFVFAIWDAREKRLFCARDPLGIKHLYYYHKPNEFFALASEIKALFKLANVPHDLNEDGLADYLTINTEDKELTLYKDIVRLPATSALSLSQSGFRVWEYWQPKEQEVRLRTSSEYHEAFREKLTEAVECRLRSAYPIGSTLSGGLDSSAVVCIASRYLHGKGKPPLETFSGVFPSVAKVDPRIDETRYIRSVVDKTGCRPHYVNVDDVSPLKNLDMIVKHADHPVGYVNLYMSSEIYKAAQSENVRVMLSGHDGDCTVSYGYEDFELLARRGRYYRLVKEAIALGRNIPSKRHSIKHLVWRRGIKPTIPLAMIGLWRSLLGREAPDKANSPVHFPLHLQSINPDFRDKRVLEERLTNSREKDFPDNISNTLFHWRVLTSGLTSLNLELNENLSEAFGIEPRHPFFDRRLIEFCINLPPGQRLYRGWTRSIFRFAMQGILPPEVQWRTGKANLGAHVKVNLFKYESEALDRIAKNSVKRLGKYIDIEKLRAAYRSCRSEPNKKDAEVMLVLTSVYLLNWLERSGFAEN